MPTKRCGQLAWHSSPSSLSIATSSGTLSHAASRGSSSSTTASRCEDLEFSCLPRRPFLLPYLRCCQALSFSAVAENAKGRRRSCTLDNGSEGPRALLDTSGGNDLACAPSVAGGGAPVDIASRVLRKPPTVRFFLRRQSNVEERYDSDGLASAQAQADRSSADPAPLSDLPVPPGRHPPPAPPPPPRRWRRRGGSASGSSSGIVAGETSTVDANGAALAVRAQWADVLPPGTKRSSTPALGPTSVLPENVVQRARLDTANADKFADFWQGKWDVRRGLVQPSTREPEAEQLTPQPTPAAALPSGGSRGRRISQPAVGSVNGREQGDGPSTRGREDVQRAAVISCGTFSGELGPRERGALPPQRCSSLRGHSSGVSRGPSERSSLRLAVPLRPSANDDWDRLTPSTSGPSGAMLPPSTKARDVMPSSGEDTREPSILEPTMPDLRSVMAGSEESDSSVGDLRRSQFLRADPGTLATPSSPRIGTRNSPQVSADGRQRIRRGRTLADMAASVFGRGSRRGSTVIDVSTSSESGARKTMSAHRTVGDTAIGSGSGNVPSLAAIAQDSYAVGIRMEDSGGGSWNGESKPNANEGSSLFRGGLVMAARRFSGAALSSLRIGNRSSLGHGQGDLRRQPGSGDGGSRMRIMDRLTSSNGDVDGDGDGEGNKGRDVQGDEDDDSEGGPRLTVRTGQDDGGGLIFVGQPPLTESGASSDDGATTPGHRKSLAASASGQSRLAVKVGAGFSTGTNGTIEPERSHPSFGGGILGIARRSKSFLPRRRGQDAAAEASADGTIEPERSHPSFGGGILGIARRSKSFLPRRHGQDAAAEAKVNNATGADVADSDAGNSVHSSVPAIPRVRQLNPRRLGPAARHPLRAAAAVVVGSDGHGLMGSRPCQDAAFALSPFLPIEPTTERGEGSSGVRGDQGGGPRPATLALVGAVDGHGPEGRQVAKIVAEALPALVARELCRRADLWWRSLPSERQVAAASRARGVNIDGMVDVCRSTRVAAFLLAAGDDEGTWPAREKGQAGWDAVPVAAPLDEADGAPQLQSNLCADSRCSFQGAVKVPTRGPRPSGTGHLLNSQIDGADMIGDSPDGPRRSALGTARGALRSIVGLATSYRRLSQTGRPSATGDATPRVSLSGGLEGGVASFRSRLSFFAGRRQSESGRHTSLSGHGDRMAGPSPSGNTIRERARALRARSTVLHENRQSAENGGGSPSTATVREWFKPRPDVAVSAVREALAEASADVPFLRPASRRAPLEPFANRLSHLNQPQAFALCQAELEFGNLDVAKRRHADVDVTFSGCSASVVLCVFSPTLDQGTANEVDVTPRPTSVGGGYAWAAWVGDSGACMVEAGDPGSHKRHKKETDAVNGDSANDTVEGSPSKGARSVTSRGSRRRGLRGLLTRASSRAPSSSGKDNAEENANDAEIAVQSRRLFGKKSFGLPPRSPDRTSISFNKAGGLDKKTPISARTSSEQMPIDRSISSVDMQSPNHAGFPLSPHRQLSGLSRDSDNAADQDEQTKYESRPSRNPRAPGLRVQLPPPSLDSPTLEAVNDATPYSGPAAAALLAWTPPHRPDDPRERAFLEAAGAHVAPLLAVVPWGREPALSLAQEGATQALAKSCHRSPADSWDEKSTHPSGEPQGLLPSSSAKGGGSSGDRSDPRSSKRRQADASRQRKKLSAALTGGASGPLRAVLAFAAPLWSRRIESSGALGGSTVRAAGPPLPECDRDGASGGLEPTVGARPGGKPPMPDGPGIGTIDLLCASSTSSRAVGAPVVERGQVFGGSSLQLSSGVTTIRLGQTAIDHADGQVDECASPSRARFIAPGHLDVMGADGSCEGIPAVTQRGVTEMRSNMANEQPSLLSMIPSHHSTIPGTADDAEGAAVLSRGRLTRRGGRIAPAPIDTDKPGHPPVRRIPIGPARVWVKGEAWPGLKLSRTLGDRAARAVGVHAGPSVSAWRLPPLSSRPRSPTMGDGASSWLSVPRGRLIVVATNGLWAMCPPEQAARTAGRAAALASTHAAAQHIATRHARPGKWPGKSPGSLGSGARPLHRSRTLDLDISSGRPLKSRGSRNAAVSAHADGGGLGSKDGSGRLGVLKSLRFRPSSSDVSEDALGDNAAASSSSPAAVLAATICNGARPGEPPEAAAVRALHRAARQGWRYAERDTGVADDTAVAVLWIPC